ncbi:hypothetical protein DPEC_G00238500 [Dallia pectoralis]|uniref:Uncharacterized protein n=1 Tax=Dallia pectoralis TaxID=75939 RepID=A0ACC2FZ23_DALPE|nr:hypothetical protein DPEC_G00238500 [Dallia pectoralis]
MSPNWLASWLLGWLAGATSLLRKVFGEKKGKYTTGKTPSPFPEPGSYLLSITDLCGLSTPTPNHLHTEEPSRLFNAFVPGSNWSNILDKKPLSSS